MREIKFRGKTLSGKWVYGYAAKFDHDSVPVILEDTEDGIEPRKIIPNTVGQFTGLHDNNGNEIYEGDILRDPHSGEVGVVEWSTMWLQYWLSICNSPSKDGLPFFVALGYAVVGNIHDNPSLDIDEQL